MATDPEVLESLARLETQSKATHDLVSNLSGALISHDRENHEDFGEIHKRVNSVERKQAWMLGVGTGIGALIGGIIMLLKDGLTKQ
jgi:hypothetical protein